jgi:hypothetical protein
MATLNQLRSDLSAHLQTDGDNFAGTAPATADLTKQINYAMRAIGRAMFLVKTQVPLATVIGTFKYELNAMSPRPVRVLFVERGGIPFKDYENREGLYSFIELARDYPGFHTGAVAGTPTAATQQDMTLYLAPKPVAVETLTMTAQVIPDDLVADGDIPDLPLWVHEAIVYVAAIYAADPVVTGEEALARLARFEQRASARIAEEAARNMKQYGIEPDNKLGPVEDNEQ